MKARTIEWEGLAKSRLEKIEALEIKIESLERIIAAGSLFSDVKPKRKQRWPRIPKHIQGDDQLLAAWYLSDEASYDQPKPDGPHYDGLIEPCRIVMAHKGGSGHGINQRQHNGTNQVRMIPKLVYAYVWGKTYEQITDTKLFIRHLCDVAACIRPSHLDLGTDKQNREDMKRRKRAGRKPKKGERNDYHTDERLSQHRGEAADEAGPGEQPV